MASIFQLKGSSHVFKAHCGHFFESSQQPSEAGLFPHLQLGKRNREARGLGQGGTVSS